MGKVNNEGLAVIAALTKAVKAKYMKEDELPPAGGDGGAGGGTKDELRAQAMKAQEEWLKMDAMDPKKTAKGAEVKALYDRLAIM